MPKRLLNDEEIAKIAKSAQLNVRLAEPEFTEEIAINKTIHKNLLTEESHENPHL